jgi:murein DD-endopeptidase MepM/ murein hydrolase activator NlpD
VGLSLPFQLRGSVWGTAGVHGDSGNSRPYNAIDFWGGDARVLASRDGMAYKFCTNSRWPYIKVVHDNGWTTGYYHMKNQPAVSNGQMVREGQFLGMTGVELPCGGRASGDHVHWTLWRSQGGAAEAVHNKTIGGWTWYEGNQPYSGYAERNGTRVYSNQRGLVNYGHDGDRTAAPCSGTGCTRYNGSLGGAGKTAFHPGPRGFYFAGGTLSAWLQGAPGTDFDLVLGRYNPSTGQWDRVAASDGPTSTESLSFKAPAGHYRWRLNGYSGSGSYTLHTKQ